MSNETEKETETVTPSSNTATATVPTAPIPQRTYLYFSNFLIASIYPSPTHVTLFSPSVIYANATSASEAAEIVRPSSSSSTPTNDKPESSSDEEDDEEDEEDEYADGADDVENEEENETKENETSKNENKTKSKTESFEEDVLERFVFKTKTLMLRQETFYDDIYGLREREENEPKSFRIYSGVQLFRHFKGLREWVMLVQMVCDGWNYIKDRNGGKQEEYFPWEDVSKKDLKFLTSKLYKLSPTTKNVLEIESIQSGLVTRKPRESYDDPSIVDETFSHNDVFDIEMRIYLKSSNPKSFFYKKTFFLFRSHKTAEYAEEIRSVPRGDLIGSYDPLIDFEEDRPIVFSQWKILNDENLPLLVTNADASDANQNEEEENNKKCMVCIDNERNRVAIPCGHLLLCIGCSQQLGGKCIVCRQKVERYITVIS